MIRNVQGVMIRRYSDGTEYEEEVHPIWILVGIALLAFWAIFPWFIGIFWMLSWIVR